MPKYSIFIIFYFFCLSSCYHPDKAQKEQHRLTNTDSLDTWFRQIENTSLPEDKYVVLLKQIKQSIDTISIDSVKLRYISKLSFTFFKLNDSDRFIESNKELEVLASNLKDSVRLAEAYWDKGAFYNLPDQAKRDSGFYYLSKSQKIFDLLNDEIHSARLLRDMASIQTAIHDNTGALVTLTEVIKLLKPQKDNRRLFEAYNTMGIAASALKEYDEALKYYDFAREYLESTDLGPTHYSKLENNIGLSYYTRGDYENAKLFFERAISRDSLIEKKPEDYARLLDHLAMTDFNLGDLSSVEDKLYRSQFIRDSIGDLEGLSLNYYNLALVNKEIGRKADAFIFAGNARDLARQIDNNLRYMESLKLLVELDPQNSNTYNKEYIRISDSLQQEERRIRDKFDRIRFETEETQIRNQQLSRQRQIWIGIAAGLMLFAMALSIIVIQRIKNQRLRFQQQQQEANQEIFNLMLAQKQKVEEGKQSEQKRISEELHDGILGEMNGVRMILLALNKKADDAAIALREQAIDKLKQVQEEIRSISHELNDASYQKFNNFISSLEDLLKTICESAGINYHFSYDQDLDWDNLEGITKINLYRILQESLQNCIKHASATSVYVSFEIEDSQMVITIQDNGRGFETSKGKKGIGHKNIESRMKKIRGKWHLKSAPGIGTTVLLEIPLEHISPKAKKEISLPKDLQEV